MSTQETEEKCGWMKRFDELQAEMTANGGRMPGPWHWEIQDSSMAVLCGGGEDAITGHIMSVGPCEACYGGKDEWLWGRCGTPSAEHARMIEALPNMLTALEQIRRRAIANSGDDLKEVQRQMMHIESLASAAIAIAKAEGGR